MNRAEYKERFARIVSCLDAGDQEEALDLLDSINWRKLHNVNILSDGAILYERAGKLYDAKELLETAHERSPMGRMILYRLSIICAMLGEIEEARGYHQKFIEIAPNDNLKYIIKYYICKAAGDSARNLIPILEELKANELLEEWAFELACLYRETGQTDKCIAVLDEIILWFGEGPYVEKAYELRNLYQPQSPQQQYGYGSREELDDSVVEIRPGDQRIASNEFIGKTIRIPEVEVSSDRFNTVNLQAEIRKNIEEMMMASEVDKVSENMDAIKDLVGDIPYLRIEEEDDRSPEEKKFDTNRLDETLKSRFNEYLSEEFDGQISLQLPEGAGEEEQIDGQMTIEDVMERWEKTRRAAEAALSDAKQQELIEYKKRAIARASDVLERLMESENAAAAGAVAIASGYENTENIEPEMLPEIEIVSVEEEEVAEQKTFVIPTVNAEGEESSEGFRIPVISASPKDEEMPDTSQTEEAIEDTSEDTKESAEHTTPEAFEAPEVSEPLGISEVPEVAEKPEISEVPEASEVSETSEASEVPEVSEEASSLIKADQALKDINNMLQSEIDRLKTEDPSDSPKESIVPEEEPQVSQAAPAAQTVMGAGAVAMASQNQRQYLTQQERRNLTYFAGIPGMERALISAISTLTETLRVEGRKDEGHLIIQGRPGSGKTRLATGLVEILKETIGKPEGNVGRISGERLNEKDIRVLFERVKGGALIIEDASKLNKDTIVSLTLIMENDRSGVLVIMEDTRPNIEKLLNQDPRFAKKFTAKVSIPVMTIDELVTFGKIYAAENGCTIEEMGILALYDRINLVGRPERPACVKDVKLIVDSAIESSKGAKTKRRRFGSKSDSSGGILLQEKDFRED